MEQSTDSSVGPSSVVPSGQKWDRVSSLRKETNVQSPQPRTWRISNYTLLLSIRGRIEEISILNGVTELPVQNVFSLSVQLLTIQCFWQQLEATVLRDVKKKRVLIKVCTKDLPLEPLGCNVLLHRGVIVITVNCGKKLRNGQQIWFLCSPF